MSRLHAISKIRSLLRSRGSARISHTSMSFCWLKTGETGLIEMLAAIQAAKESVRLEMYIIQPGEPGESFRNALVAAVKRGVRVQVLADALGSVSLPKNFWLPMTAAGGEFRYFNLPGLDRMGLRDHRKLMVCDDHRVFIGGINIGPEYAGDGVNKGWRDLGLHFHGTLARELSAAFDEMFAIAEFKHSRFAWLRHAIRQRRIEANEVTVLLGAPGWRHNHMIRSLVRDFKKAQDIRIICAYFLPTIRVLHALRRAARRGARVQLILAAHSDIPLMRLASHGLYRRLLKDGVEIYEYQPQVLHAKLIIVNHDTVYAGSANLDVRSLVLNYELLLRIENHGFAKEAEEIFEGDLAHCKRIEFEEWSKGRHWWHRFLGRIAYFCLATLDPYVASRSWRR